MPIDDRDDREHDTPSLEPPSFGFGRKRRKKAAPTAPEPAEAPPVAPDEPLAESVDDDVAPTPVVEEPAEEATDEADADAGVEAEEPAPLEDDQPTQVVEPTEPTSGETPTPLFADEVPDAVEDDAPDEVDAPSDIQDHPTGPAAAAAPAPATVAAPAAAVAVDSPTSGAPEPAETRVPALTGPAAAAAAGLLVGAFIVLATFGALHLCEVVRGSSSCGGPGFLLLGAIMIVGVLVGSAVLRFAGVPDPGSTSFLAVALVTVIALLFFADALLDWWMIIAIPLVSVLAYSISHWVTTSLVDSADD